MAEHLTRNEKVVGSIPTISSIPMEPCSMGISFYLTSSGGMNLPCDRKECLWYGDSATPRFTTNPLLHFYLDILKYLCLNVSIILKLFSKSEDSCWIIHCYIVRKYHHEKREKFMSCENQRPCTCRNINCKNHGRCCACVATHRERGNLPFCLFTPEQIAEMERNRPKMPPPDHH